MGRIQFWLSRQLPLTVKILKQRQSKLKGGAHEG